MGGGLRYEGAGGTVNKHFAISPGGELEGPGQRVFGAASFEVGEPVGVFLTRRADALDRAPR